MSASSGVTADTLKQKLAQELEATHVQVDDLSGGCGQMFDAVIVSPKFAGQRLLGRNRTVNGVLKAEIAAIHAWSAKCFTPEEWEAKKTA
ncbi:bola-like protein [Xylona heveae TC161]|uniref:Bola-like protein n=1 Tax=Xylona heveae (strain CBS 132557 / TC161) TaxID=1328760 RepID=A0A165G8J6_XYLHT|nr:bola-like protein [Xylona heveae TC161]KZF21869.1 bola-like protein [Xylona heveae TC161]